MYFYLPRFPWTVTVSADKRRLPKGIAQRGWVNRQTLASAALFLEEFGPCTLEVLWPGGVRERFKIVNQLKGEPAWQQL